MQYLLAIIIGVYAVAIALTLSKICVILATNGWWCGLVHRKFWLAYNPEIQRHHNFAFHCCECGRDW